MKPMVWLSRNAGSPNPDQLKSSLPAVEEIEAELWKGGWDECTELENHISERCKDRSCHRYILENLSDTGTAYFQ
ncbi:MAG: hypothetical protein A2277_19485 [Desulfobacterales bacterium RIFOXYA12_FULL_46_15]|nr:MAG: hypothetical protein A2097_00695 [Desulfobacula sp. GWF2_41_7]OGR25168.1 MAG: hypothetical protein A2277_19485 [Desulfobacterales bacterium RIFOXYA12_FULL_46_15]